MKKNNSRFSGNKKSQGGKPTSRNARPGAGAVLGGGGPRRGNDRATSNSPRSENFIPREWRVVIGTHAITEALKVRPKKIKGMWLRQGWEGSADLRELNDLAVAARVKVEVKADAVIEKFGSSIQGAAVFVDGGPDFNLTNMGKSENSIVLILDGIEDPHNLGAIVRTSWLTGVQGVLIPEDRAVGLTPTVHKVACGGIEHVPVQETTNFQKYAEELKEKGYWIFGLSPRGEKSIFELNLPEKVVWAIGAEDKGLRVNTERLCDELVYIPQASASASYNASVATAMALTETLRQHASKAALKKS
jgi:23S rRNA (guanosine2251-2'-O)-methyltransferase